MNTRQEAVSLAYDIASDDWHGYSQVNRVGPQDFDCSALGAYVYGWRAPELWNIYSGNIVEYFREEGASIHRWDGNFGDLEPGDLLVRVGHHVAIVGYGELVEARIDESGGVQGKVPGDQTGREICVSEYYDPGWDYVISPEDGGLDMDEATVKRLCREAINESVEYIADRAADKVWRYNLIGGNGYKADAGQRMCRQDDKTQNILNTVKSIRANLKEILSRL